MAGGDGQGHFWKSFKRKPFFLRMASLRKAIFEIVTLAEDYRAQLVGGFLAILDLWTSTALASLLYSCSIWLGLTKEAENILDNCQNLLFWAAFRTGPGCATD